MLAASGGSSAERDFELLRRLRAASAQPSDLTAGGTDFAKNLLTVHWVRTHISRESVGEAADRYRDLLVIQQEDVGGISRLSLAVDEHHVVRIGLAVAADARTVEPNPPLIEQLAEGELSPRWRLDVDDPGHIVRVWGEMQGRGHTPAGGRPAL
jgi:hypothetical protein